MADKRDTSQPKSRDYVPNLGGQRRAKTTDYTPNFSRMNLDSTLAPEDYKPVFPTAGEDIFLSSPAYDELKISSVKSLRKAGYDQGTIDAIMQPGGLQQFETVLDFEEIYKTLQPGFAADGAAALETLRQVEHMRSKGIEITPEQTSTMRVFLAAFAEDAGPSVLSALADADRWYRRMQHGIAESVAGKAAMEGITEVGLGLAGLDFFSVLNKVQKLPFIPAEQRADVEARVLPPIDLKDELDKTRTFSNGSSAALWMLQQRIRGVQMVNREQGLGMTPARLGHAFVDIASGAGFRMHVNAPAPGDPSAQSFFDTVKQEIPKLTSLVGEPLSWQEVVDRQIDYHADETGVNVDDIYTYISDLPGHYQGPTIAAMAVTSALADVFGDLMWALPGTGLARTMERGGRAAGKLLTKSSKGVLALQAAKIFKKTERFEDALNSLTEAQAHLTSMRKVGVAQKSSMGRMTEETARRTRQAEIMVKDAEMFKATFRDPGAYEVFVTRRTPRRAPGMIIEGEEAAKEFSDVPRVAKELSKSRELEVRRDFDLVATFEKQTEAEQARRALMGPDSAEQYGDALNLAYRTGGLGIDDVAVTPYSVIDQRAPDVITGLTKDIPKNSPKITNEFGNLERYAKSDLSKSTIRLLLNDLEKTRKSLGEARNVKGPVVTIGPKGGVKAVGPSKAIAALEKEIEAMRRTKPTQIEGESPLATFIRGGKDAKPQGTLRTTEELILKKEQQLANLRRELQGPNKPLIQELEQEMVRIKKTAKDLSKQDFFKEHTKYDDVYLPGAQEPYTESPSRLNRLLEVAGDHIAEGLYPGSLMLNTFWDTKMGQVFAPLREPLRYYDQYDPKTAELIRGGYMREKQAREGVQELFSTILTRGRVLTPRGKWNPIKKFKPYKTDKARSEELFDLMNVAKKSKEYKAAYEAADPDIRRASDELRPLFDHFADQYGISDTERYINGYMHHFIEPTMFSKSARPIELQGIPAKANAFIAHLLNRTGAVGYEHDITLALDLYARAMPRKLYLEPVWRGVLDAGDALHVKFDNGMFSTYSKMLVNNLQGKPSFVGKLLDQSIGGPWSGKGNYVPGKVDRALMGMTGLLWGGTLAGNPRYPIMQMSTGALTAAGRFGLGRTAKGLFQMATPEGQALAKRMGLYTQFTDMFEAPFMRQLSIALSETPAITPLGIMSTAKTEFYIRGATLHAALDMMLTKAGFRTLAEARAAGFEKRIGYEVIRKTEEINHMYGPLGRSPVAGAVLPKGMVISGTQFLSFVPKQVEELASQFTRNPGHIAEYLMLSGWLSRVAAEEMGIDLTSYSGLGFLPSGGDDVTSPAMGMFLDGISMLEAIGTHDPERATMYMDRFMNTGSNLIPLMNVWKTTGKTARRLYEGEETTATGVKTRSMDFIGVKERVRNKEYNIIKNIMESIRPEEKKTTGGDYLATFGGQRNINDTLYHRGKMATIAQNKKRLFLQNSAAAKVADAALRGSTDDLVKAIAEFNSLVLRDEFRITTDDPFEAALQAGMFGWAFRELKRSKKYADKTLQTMEQFGMDITP